MRPPSVQRRARRVLLVALACFGALGVVYSVVVPLFEAPDELWHFSFIRVLATERALPVQPTEGKDMWLREAGQPPLYYLLMAPLVGVMDTADFPDYVRFNVAHPAVTAGSDSRTPNVFIHTPHERFPYRGSVLAIHLVRALTTAWGIGTVVGAYHLAREIAPHRLTLALATATLTAFNPHFVFISSVVNNDACAACLCTLVLWRLVRFVRSARDLPSTAMLGALLGLALLSKMSALALVGLAGLALALAWYRERNLSALLIHGALIFGIAALIGAWWYVRNWALYGDPLAWNVWLIDIAESTIGPLELIRQFRRVATSYWSPYDGLFPVWVFWGFGLLALVAVAGWLRTIRRVMAGAHERAAGQSALSTEGMLLVGAWFVMLFASLVKYMLTTPSDEGRLLFPGIAAFSLLLALGIEQAIECATECAIECAIECATDRATPVLAAVGIGLLALSTATPFFAIAPRYALPLVASVDEIAETAFPVNETFGDVQLLGVEVFPDEVRQGDTVNVTLYWEALAPPPDDLRAVVQVWTLGGRLIGQRDVTPAGEIYPPDLWRPGDIVQDAYGLAIGEDENVPAICHATVRVMDGDELLGSVSTPAALRLKPPPASEDEMAHPMTGHQAVTLDDRVALAGYTLPDPLPRAGDPLTVTLYWRVIAPLAEDYVVFAHLLDGTGSLIAQGDGPPLNNDYPTSYWRSGEMLIDPHVIALTDDLPIDAHLQVGLYRLGDGVRLPAYDDAGNRLLNDAIPLEVTSDAKE